MTTGQNAHGAFASARAPRWVPVWGAALVWAAVGLTAAYWALNLWQPRADVAVPVLPERPRSLDSQRVARALGAGALLVEEPAARPSTQHTLVGLATDGSGRGVALISTDNAPARNYRVGASLPDGMVLRSLGARDAGLAPSAEAPVNVRLELPKPMSSRTAQ